MTNQKTENELEAENKTPAISQPAKDVAKPAAATAPAPKKSRATKAAPAAAPQAYEQIGIFSDKPLPTRSAASRQTTDEKKLRKVKELSVFTFAKQMTKYVFQCTKKSPKVYRWSVVAKMQAISLEFIEKLYNANAKIDDARLALQFEADTQLKLLAFTAEIAKDMSVISAHQFKTLSKHLLDCKKTLWGWIKCKK